MTNFTKPDMRRAWANNGAIVPPDNAQIDLGWIAEKPPYQTENWVQNRTDVYLQHLDERGCPEWDQYVIYFIGSRVFYENEIWQSLVDSNLGNAPVAGQGEWVPVTELHNPPGIVSAFAGSAAPVGWLLCDGAEISRTEYARLFAYIGTTFGDGDGSTTFNIPDAIDRVLSGAGGDRELGQKFGSNTRTLSIANMPAHNHGGGNHFHSEGMSSTEWGGTAASGADATWNRIYNRSNTSYSGNVIGWEGSSTAFSIEQRSIGMNWIIKT